MTDLALLVGWDEQPHVRAATGLGDADSPEWHELLAGAAPGWQHFVAEAGDGDDPVAFGVVQIVDSSKDPARHGDPLATSAHRALHIWIGPAEWLSQGLGPRMMQIAIEHCFADPTVGVVVIEPLVSNTRAIAFYRRLGFQIIGPRRYGEDDCLALCLQRPGTLQEI